MPFPEGREEDLQCLQVERLGLGVPARRLVQGRQVVQGGGKENRSGLALVGPFTDDGGSGGRRLIVARL